MTKASGRGGRTARSLCRAAQIAAIVLLSLVAGCEREPQQPDPPSTIDTSRVQVVAYVNADSPCQAGTIELLRGLAGETPTRLHLTIVDVDTPEGRDRWEESGHDALAIEIGGSSTVTWGQGESRRTISFLHPAGFAWSHDDLRAAIAAALAGELRPADPAEAEGVRLMDVTVRGQSIRVEDEGAETGQLIIQDQIVLEVTAPREDLAPGQRVALAAATLSVVLEKSFTPNQLRTEQADGGTALVAGEAAVLVATETDVAGREISTGTLAEQWRRAVHEALIQVALQRSLAPEPTPEPEAEPAAPADPLDALTAPLTPENP